MIIYRQRLLIELFSLVQSNDRAGSNSVNGAIFGVLASVSEVAK